MAHIETWGASNNAWKKRTARPIGPTSQHHRALARKAGLTPMQQDMEILRLDPWRQLQNTRHLIKVVAQVWPPGDDPEDTRPHGWGWKQTQAYSRLYSHFLNQRPRR